MMRWGVCIKETPDSEVKIGVSEDGTKILTEGKRIVNPFDEYALEEALKYKEAHPEIEIVTLTVGPKSASQTIRTALAMGADRAVLIVVENIDSLDCLGIARILQKIAVSENLDIITLGAKAFDGGCGQTAPMLAGLLSWPQATHVIKMNIVAASISAVRIGDEGCEETVEISIPAVISVTKGINIPRIPSLKGIMSARKKEIREISLSSLELEQSSLNGFENPHYYSNETTKKCRMIEGDPRTSAQELVRLLREESRVL